VRRFSPICLIAFTCLSTLSCTDEPSGLAGERPGGRRTEPASYLALGDSYTIGQGVSENERWPVQLTARLIEDGITIDTTLIIAMTGWRTDDLLAATAEEDLGRDWDIVSLLIGVNDQFQGRAIRQYEDGLTALIQRAVELAGGRRGNVFVLSIPDYGFTPFGEADRLTISPDIDMFNRAARAIAAAAGVQFFDITHISRLGLERPSYVAQDGLHPSGVQYDAWVDLILDDVARLLSAAVPARSAWRLSRRAPTVTGDD
jgi:lysophospholipase L1-like esterase